MTGSIEATPGLVKPPVPPNVPDGANLSAVFTGLVQATGRIIATRRTRRGVRLSVRAPDWGYVPERGESIAVSGCCLTVADEVGGPDPILQFDVVPETLNKTKLGQFRVGSPVNLEHAATLSTMLGGHLVQGHVDGVATVLCVKKPAGFKSRVCKRAPQEWRVRIAVAPGKNKGRTKVAAGDLMQYIVPKGSVCIDGVSLTVADLFDDRRPGEARGFEVALIPETLEKTTLGSLRAGDVVNLEVDAIAKTVVHWLRNFGVGEARGVVDKRRSGQ